MLFCVPFFGGTWCIITVRKGTVKSLIRLFPRAIFFTQIAIIYRSFGFSCGSWHGTILSVGFYPLTRQRENNDTNG